MTEKNNQAEAKILGQAPTLDIEVTEMPLKSTGLLPSEMLTKKSLWKVQAEGGVVATYTGFELAQMLSSKGKKATIGGETKFRDGRFKVEFKGLNQ